MKRDQERNDMRTIIFVGLFLSLIPGSVYGMKEDGSSGPSLLRMSKAITTLIKKDMGRSEDDSLGPCDCCAVICCCQCLRDPIEKFTNDPNPGDGVGAIGGTALPAALSLFGFYSGSNGAAFVFSLPYINTARLWAMALYNRNKKKRE